MRTYLHQFGSALAYFFKALTFILKHNLSWFFFFPIIIFIGVMALGISSITSVVDFMQTTVNIEHIDFVGIEYVAKIITAIVWIFAILIFVYFGGFLSLIILSPVLAILSERTEAIYNGTRYKTNFTQIIKDTCRGIILALRNLLWEFIWIILVFIASIILGFIPVIGWIFAICSPVLLILITSYYYGFSFMDYVYERRKYSISRSVYVSKENKSLIVGHGFIFAVTLSVPVIGTFFSGFVAIISVVSATLSVIDLEKNGSVQFPKHENELQNTFSE